MVLPLSLLSLLLLEIMCGTIKPQKIQSLTIIMPNLNKKKAGFSLGRDAFCIIINLKICFLTMGHFNFCGNSLFNFQKNFTKYRLFNFINIYLLFCCD